MTEITDSSPAPKSRWKRTLSIMLLAFFAGIAAMGWGLTQTAPGHWLLGQSRETPAAAPRQTLAGSPAPAVNAPALPGTIIDPNVRIATLEARLAQLEASGGNLNNAGRAEGLLLAFAARRALERGLALGYVEGELNAHFGSTQPRAVGAIIAASRTPVTAADLRAQLVALAPALIGGGPDEGFWEGVQRGMGNLIAIRDAREPVVTPDARFERALTLIDSRQTAGALAEIARIPNNARAAGWMANARRVVEAERALDLLEAAAIAAPVPTRPAPQTAEPVREAAKPDSL